MYYLEGLEGLFSKENAKKNQYYYYNGGGE